MISSIGLCVSLANMSGYRPAISMTIFQHQPAIFADTVQQTHAQRTLAMSEDKALVERLREKPCRFGNETNDMATARRNKERLEAANHIEAQAAEIARLTTAYNDLGNSAVKQVAEMGTALGRKDVELDAAHADLQAANREIARLREFMQRIAEPFDEDHPIPASFYRHLAQEQRDIARKALGEQP